MLENARKTEAEKMKRISPGERPAFHLTPPAGWMNDPNGFSFYNGQYHLFFQYNPYAAHWDKMHWGHAVSSNLLKWDYRPTALAPDSAVDEGGCFSGSAVTLADGRHLLMYTGLTHLHAGKGSAAKDSNTQGGADGSEYDQVQNIAVGDGTNYVKYEKNPVIDSSQLPEGLRPIDFRDPKIIVLKDGSFGALTVSMDGEGRGRVLLYQSRDGFSWQFRREFCRNEGKFGKMWECPDLFELDGKWFLLVSPMEMCAKGQDYHNGNVTVVLAGSLDEDTMEFVPDYDQTVDYGIDFYAAQTILSPDGRRIMIGWMQNWESITMRDEDAPWAGQMTLPRELSFHDGRLYQQPVQELAGCYSSSVFYRKVPVSDEFSLYGVEGRMIDLDVTVRPVPGEPLYRYFSIRFAIGGDQYSEASYSPDTGLFLIDRENSGSRRALKHQQRCSVPESRDGNLSVRIILDRYSFEVFINHGRYVMSAVIYTDPHAEQITFCAGGKALIDVSMREISLEDNPGSQEH